MIKGINQIIKKVPILQTYKILNYKKGYFVIQNAHTCEFLSFKIYQRERVCVCVCVK